MNLMGLTTERKIFLALAAVAGASLIVDQAILSPKGAAAAPLDVASIEAQPDEPILAGIAKPIAKSVTDILNERLSEKSSGTSVDLQSTDLQNMFAPLIKPKQQVQQKQVSLTQQAEPVATASSQQIPANLPALSAVMPSRSGESGAILNATLYRVGETTPEGYLLLKVDDRRVMVRYQDHEYWISLPAFEE